MAAALDRLHHADIKSLFLKKRPQHKRHNRFAYPGVRARDKNPFLHLIARTHITSNVA